MYSWNMVNELPPMLTGKELKEKLMILPDYDESIRLGSQAERLMALNDIYKVYLPSQMSCEIYSKIYLSMLRSLQKKGTKEAIQQRYANYRGMKLQGGYQGIVGGSDSYTIIGESGIGKSSSISRAVVLATENKIIEMEEPYCKIIPALSIQCPFDCSVKSLLLEVLRLVDERIDTHYFDRAIHSKATVDILIGSVSQVALNHIGLLIVDEIQNVIRHKGGMQLVGCLTQLINNSGISICMVGTPEAEKFFEEVDYLSRRALGLYYSQCEYNEYFRQFCEVLFHYQYVQNESELSDGMVQWLYEHSGGVLATVVTLIHDAQEIAIWNGRECLDISTLDEAYEKRMRMLHFHISPTTLTNKETKKRKAVTAKQMVTNQLEKKEKSCDVSEGTSWSLVELAEYSKKEKQDIVELLREKVSVTEITV